MGVDDDARARLLAMAARQEGVGGAAAVDVPDEQDAPAVSVQREEAGYALVGFDLRALAQATGAQSGLAVVLPSFVIILLIAAVLSNLLKYAGVQAFLSGVRPCVVALILATALTMGLGTLFSFTTIRSAPEVDLRGVVILLLLITLHFGYKHFKKKAPSPILMIVLSAGLGILFYAF